jgi:hypothetical protein
MDGLLLVGDRVIKPGFKFKDEPDRHGVVVDTYEGRKNGLGIGDQMLVVRFDDGATERGFIQGGQLRREPIMIPTCWTKT